jgi:ferrous iron transport protein A
MNFFSRFLFDKPKATSSKKKQTFDCEGEAIISKFVNVGQNTMVALPPKEKKMEIKLSEMEPGQEGIIQKFNNDDLLLKLMEMGCLPGERIILEQVAPLGDPISVSISGYSLSLRLNEAENIVVEVTN